jgi:hypothetical protein
MKVYTVVSHYDYEGETLEGVFASREDAFDWFNRLKGSDGYFRSSYRIYESELGELVCSFDYETMTRDGIRI